MSNPSEDIVFENVSKFYGEVLGVNRIDLTIKPGITGLVGPNGSGKTTLMNLMTGLVRPTRGSIRLAGIDPGQPEALFRRLGYCPQFDTFPAGLTGYELLFSYLSLHGHGHRTTAKLVDQALARVDLTEAGKRPLASYSKGMRQRLKLAHAIAHKPEILVLDEPLNGLDPVARAETIALFRMLASEGNHLIISSHILHEVDMFSDEVVLLQAGYVVAEGQIRGIREDIKERPIQVSLRCDKAALLASHLFAHDVATEVKLHEDKRGLLVRSTESDRFHFLLNRVVVEEGLTMTAMGPADEDMGAVYHYLIGQGGEPS